MKKTTLIVLQVMITAIVFGQWDSPGTQRTSHGNGSQPQILGFGGALLELQESNQSAAGSANGLFFTCLLYTSPSPRDQRGSRMPSSA